MKIARKGYKRTNQGRPKKNKKKKKKRKNKTDTKKI